MEFLGTNSGSNMVGGGSIAVGQSGSFGSQRPSIAKSVDTSDLLIQVNQLMAAAKKDKILYRKKLRT